MTVLSACLVASAAAVPTWLRAAAVGPQSLEDAAFAAAAALIQEHFTDTGGASDHVFGLFALIGKRFAPRLRNLKDRNFHACEKGDA